MSPSSGNNKYSSHPFCEKCHDYDKAVLVWDEDPFDSEMNQDTSEEVWLCQSCREDSAWDV